MTSEKKLRKIDICIFFMHNCTTNQSYHIHKIKILRHLLLLLRYFKEIKSAEKH